MNKVSRVLISQLLQKKENQNRIQGVKKSRVFKDQHQSKPASKTSLQSTPRKGFKRKGQLMPIRTVRNRGDHALGWRYMEKN